MSKQDRQGARTVTELERKYNFGQSFEAVMETAQSAGDQARKAAAEAKTAKTAAADAKTAVKELDTKLGAEEVFSRLTGNGTVQGLFRGEDGNLYFNASYINTGTLLADLIKAGTIKSRDGESLVIDLDEGTAEITGSYKTVETKNDSGNIASGELMPAWVRLITKNPDSGSNVNFAHFTSHVLELGEGISKNITLLVPEFGSGSDEIKLMLDDLDFGGIDFLVSPSSKSVSADLYNGTDGTNIQVLLKNGRATVTGLTAPVNAADAATKAYVDKGLTEDSSFPGCYYRTVNGEKEWLNPPLLLGEEYRTTGRWRGISVYQKYMYLGVTTAGTVTLDHGITDFSGCLEIQLSDESHQNITHHGNIQSLYVTGEGVHITAGTAQTIYATIQYTKI